MNYQNGWIHLDDATENQLLEEHDIRRDELAAEAAMLFREIPEPCDTCEEQIEQDLNDASAFVLWRKIEQIEKLMHDSGARFVRNNERWNEDERRMDYQDNSCARY